MLVPGLALGRYELLFRAGRGGMGEVWCARATGKLGFERLVAIKVLAPEHGLDPAFRSMFLTEAKLAGQIHHEHVAAVLDVGEHAQTAYIVLEWVAGESLAKLLRLLRGSEEGASPLTLVPLECWLRILIDTCSGLHAAHETRASNGAPLDIVHRDVTPANIMVGVDGAAKLIDFGIAHARQREGDRTQTGILKGTPRFMSPEQVLADQVDRRSDVWSLGVVLYHVLSGSFPYGHENDARLLVSISTNKPRLPLPASIPLPLVRVVDRALAFAPSDRFASALELRAALEAAARSLQLDLSREALAAFLATKLGPQFEAHRALMREAESWMEQMPTRMVMPRFEPPPTLVVHDIPRTQALGPVAAVAPAVPVASSAPVAPVAPVASSARRVPFWAFGVAVVAATGIGLALALALPASARWTAPVRSASTAARAYRPSTRPSPYPSTVAFSPAVSLPVAPTAAPPIVPGSVAPSRPKKPNTLDRAMEHR
jgi:serine/threonine-protein kinase